MMSPSWLADLPFKLIFFVSTLLYNFTFSLLNFERVNIRCICTLAVNLVSYG